jgi:phospholipase/lecithinase/hemolysin
MANKAPSTKPLILAMVTAFNDALQAGLAGTAGVIIVDAFHNIQDEVNHPEQYSLSNVKDTACDLAKVNATSLLCSAATLVAGDTSHYLFADDVHPTPYGHQLLGQLVSRDLAKAGWL